MKKISKNKYSLKLVTTVTSIILVFSTIGFTNGIQTNNITDIFNNSRGTTYLSIVPSNQTVGYGETFNIIVHLDPGEPIIGVQIDLSFNASLVHANSVANANPAVWNFFQPGVINNTIGEIHGACVAILGSTVSTPIDCFNISFTAQNTTGTSPLTLHNVIITNQTASPITPVINNGQVTVVGTVNLPPTFGTPSPVNGSTNQPLSFTWSIPISDPEGDLFSWSIECSNGQVNSGSSASNGTKSLSLSGLAYLTTYTVWVNATDPGGSGQYTRSWYTFTTKANLPPIFGTPSPANGSTNQPLSFTWSIPISDPEGDLFSWTIQCNNGQTNTGTGATNGTKSLSLSGLTYSTTYTVWVNATDPGGSGQYTRSWYTFTTKANIPPSLGTPTPANGSTNQPLSFTWSIPISDPDDLISWTIQCSNGQSSSGNNQSSGTKSLQLTGLSYGTTYTVWVNATDGYDWVRGWFIFTTLINNPPVFGTPSPANGSTNQPLSFTWSIPISDPEGDLFSWSIECSNGQSNSGSGASNGTKSLVLSGLAYSTTYTVWVNATDPGGSSQYTRAWYTFTTKANLPPNTPGNPNPGNGAVNVNINTILSWSCSDPDGDPLTFDVYFGTEYPPALVSSNQSNKSYNPGKMNFSTHYYWRIVAWDNHGASTSGPIWDFTTSSNTPPKTPGAPSGPTSGKQGQVYEYTAVTTDSDNDKIYYQFDWGDGSNSGWIGPYNSGEQASASHSWVKGTYSIRVKAKDSNNAESGWSDPTTVKIPRTMDVKSQILNRITLILQKLQHQFKYIFFGQLILIITNL